MRKIWSGKFFLWFALTFVSLSLGAYALGLNPSGVTEFWGGLFLREENISPEQIVRGYPQALLIPAIALQVSVFNPESQDDGVITRALEEGPVRYPGSGMLGTSQNILLFGHSSGLPLVQNPAFKVFNRLQELKSGDEVRLEGVSQGFVYQVDSVKKVLAGEERVDIGKNGGKLVLSTCNVWGAKEERYVVRSSFVKSYPLKK